MILEDVMNSKYSGIFSHSVVKENSHFRANKKLGYYVSGCLFVAYLQYSLVFTACRTKLCTHVNKKGGSFRSESRVVQFFEELIAEVED